MRRTALTSSVACLATLLASLVTPWLLVSPARAGEPVRPEVGSCHDLTLEQIGGRADPEDGVACTARHTTLTTAVVDKPARLDWRGDALAGWSLARCQGDLIDFFGRGDADRLALSAYEVVFFYPTVAERDAGATWVRCDLALLGDSVALPLPRDGAPRLGRLPDSVALCLAPERKQFAQTVCARPHVFRSVTTVRSRQRTYPGDRGWRKLSRRCPERAPFYVFPDRDTYRGGDVHLVCLDKTRR